MNILIFAWILLLCTVIQIYCNDASRNPRIMQMILRGRTDGEIDQITKALSMGNKYSSEYIFPLDTSMLLPRIDLSTQEEFIPGVPFDGFADKQVENPLSHFMKDQVEGLDQSALSQLASTFKIKSEQGNLGNSTYEGFAGTWNSVKDTSNVDLSVESAISNSPLLRTALIHSTSDLSRLNLQTLSIFSEILKMTKSNAKNFETIGTLKTETSYLLRNASITKHQTEQILNEIQELKSFVDDETRQAENLEEHNFIILGKLEDLRIQNGLLTATAEELHAEVEDLKRIQHMLLSENEKMLDEVARINSDLPDLKSFMELSEEIFTKIQELDRKIRP